MVDRLSGQTVAMATMHGKDRAFGPVFAHRFGITLVVPDGIDTDRLGTFTGEVPRPGSIEETVISKARLGAEISGLNLSLASEGAYGPHPHIPFLGAGVEVAVSYDAGSGRVVREHLFDEKPVYGHLDVMGDTDITGFLARIGFPQQAVIVRHKDRFDHMVKGLQDRDDLDAAIERLRRQAPADPIFLQTDMRAHLNPKRVETLGRLAEKLAARLATDCPSCSAPGFGLTTTEKGLPCECCGCTTDFVRMEIWSCTACGHREKRPRRDGKTGADPRLCAICNP